MEQLLHRLNTNKPVMEPNDNQAMNLSEKHNHNNYTKWSKGTKSNDMQPSHNYGKLITLWKEIDRRVPNPMTCSDDITVYNEITQKNRVYHSWPV